MDLRKEWLRKHRNLWEKLDPEVFTHHFDVIGYQMQDAGLFTKRESRISIARVIQNLVKQLKEEEK